MELWALRVYYVMQQEERRSIKYFVHIEETLKRAFTIKDILNFYNPCLKLRPVEHKIIYEAIFVKYIASVI